MLLAKSNPLKEKFYDLTRKEDDNIAREIRPSPEEKKVLEEIIEKPDFIEMTESEKAMVWRFRYSLKEKPIALVKFLQSFKIDVEKEREETKKLFKEWSKITHEEAIPLLSFRFAANSYYKEEINQDPTLADFYHEVRSKAVEVLMDRSDEEIRSILL